MTHKTIGEVHKESGNRAEPTHFYDPELKKIVRIGPKFATTDIDHHTDGSHTVRHTLRDKSAEPVTYAVGNDDELVQSLNEHLGSSVLPGHP
jgi:hypothetical protein